MKTGKSFEGERQEKFRIFPCEFSRFEPGIGGRELNIFDSDKLHSSHWRRNDRNIKNKYEKAYQD